MQVSVGKRKTSVAIARIAKGSGSIKINSFPITLFEPELYKLRVSEPLVLAGDLANKVDIEVSSKGGGRATQTDAIRTAIAVALVEFSKDEALKKKFKDYDRNLLVSDMRQKEASKPGGRGARKKRQKSYR